MRAARLVDTGLETAGQEVELAAREPEHEDRGVRGVVDGVCDRYLGRKRGARRLGGYPLGRYGDHRLEARRRVEALGAPLVTDHEAATERSRHVVGMTLERGRGGEQVGVELEH